jgi:hypothetical protein
MPALTTSEADYPAKRSCLSEQPIFKGFPSQSLLRATSRSPRSLSGDAFMVLVSITVYVATLTTSRKHYTLMEALKFIYIVQLEYNFRKNCRSSLAWL